MKIWVSSLAEVHNVAARERPRKAISLLSPEDMFPEIHGLNGGEHHRVHVHDICEPQVGCVLPSHEHIEGLIRFLHDWRTDEPLLVHCWAGISRSTAAAFVAACLHNPQVDEHGIAARLRRTSPTAYPNARIVALADEILLRKGRMSAAVAALGPADLAFEAVPFSIPTRF